MQLSFDFWFIYLSLFTYLKQKAGESRERKKRFWGTKVNYVDQRRTKHISPSACLTWYRWLHLNWAWWSGIKVRLLWRRRSPVTMTLTRESDVITFDETPGGERSTSPCRSCTNLSSQIEVFRILHLNIHINCDRNPSLCTEQHVLLCLLALTDVLD